MSTTRQDRPDLWEQYATTREPRVMFAERVCKELGTTPEFSDAESIYLEMLDLFTYTCRLERHKAQSLAWWYASTGGHIEEDPKCNSPKPAGNAGASCGIW